MGGDKAALRARQRARTLDPAQRAEQSKRLCARLLTLDLLTQAREVALFAGVGHEPQMRAVFDALAPRRRWLPRVDGPTELLWCAVSDWAALQPGALGISEPVGAGERILPPSVDVVLVPGLAFDPRGGRLGWGRGYYDRALAQAPGARRVGVCLEPGLVDAVPMESHDRPMHMVVTPSEVYA